MNCARIGTDGRVSRKAVWGGEVGHPLLRLASVLVLTALTASCGDMSRQGTGSSYLIIQELQGASGANPSDFGGTVLSDVFTVVDDRGTIFNDLARVRFALALKDPGGATSPTVPTQAQWITLNRYHVRYIRADGRNTPGVDVPSGFDSAFTGTVSNQELTVGFELVRSIAKTQAPLGALRTDPALITTIPEITFYGRDQTGREVSVVGQIGINFGNFADPE
jgi:hypothetical protein